VRHVAIFNHSSGGILFQQDVEKSLCAHRIGAPSQLNREFAKTTTKTLRFAISWSNFCRAKRFACAVHPFDATEKLDMKIVFGFVGGYLNDEVISSGDPDGGVADDVDATACYLDSGCGQVGHRFDVPNLGGFETYEVVRRLENGNSVIIRARHVAQSGSCRSLE